MQQDHPHSPNEPTSFGRGWIPQERDIGLPNDPRLHIAAPAHANSHQQTDPAQHHAFTAPRRVKFLDSLSQHGNVRSACAAVGISAQAAYLARRRCPHFAAGWSAALLLAREAAEQLLATRALEGVEEAIFYHGAEIGHRRRYCSRLLLAHLARLDRRAEDPMAETFASRFDEILAQVGGAQIPADMRVDPEYDPYDSPLLSQPREDYAKQTGRMAVYADEAAQPKPEAGKKPGKIHFEESPIYAKSLAKAEARWDQWQSQTHATVDALLSTDQFMSSVDKPAAPCLSVADDFVEAPLQPENHHAKEEPPMEFKSANPPISPAPKSKRLRKIPKPYTVSTLSTWRGHQSQLTNAKWWAVRGSNPRPSRCKRDALPTELTAPFRSDPQTARSAVLYTKAPFGQHGIDRQTATTTPPLNDPLSLNDLWPPATATAKHSSE